MSAELDLDDVAAQSPKAARELAALRVGHERYETVRRMNAQQFKDAFTLSLRTGKPFDEIVDDLRPFVRPDPTHVG